MFPCMHPQPKMPSQTNVTTEALRTLHRIHRQLSDLRQRLRRGPNLLRAHQANVANREAELAKVQDETKAVRMAADRKQDQLKDGETRIAKLQQQLNGASSNREYQTLKEQIVAIEMTNSVLTDEILEGLEKIDQFKEKLAQSEATAVKAHQLAEKAEKEISQQEPLIRADIQRLEAELTEAEAGLPGDFRILYQRVVRAKGEDALAAVQGEFCGGCNQHIPINMVNDLMLSRPIFCKSCGRLLYLPENHSRG